MKQSIRTAPVILLLALASAFSLADEPQVAVDRMRILSWNISDDAFVAQLREFTSLLRWADPDMVLLDEVAPSAEVKSRADFPDRQ